MRGDYAHTSKFWDSLVNSPHLLQSDFGLLDARASLRATDGNWELIAQGTNLTDERYIINGIDTTGGLGYVESNYGRPREWALSLRYNF